MPPTKSLICLSKDLVLKYYNTACYLMHYHFCCLYCAVLLGRRIPFFCNFFLFIIEMSILLGFIYLNDFIQNFQTSSRNPEEKGHFRIFQQRKEAHITTDKPFQGIMEPDVWERYKALWRIILSIWKRLGSCRGYREGSSSDGSSDQGGSPPCPRPPYHMTI
jgi:hypothetical protein